MSDEIIITITIRGGSVTVGGAASGAGQAADVVRSDDDHFLSHGFSFE